VNLSETCGVLYQNKVRNSASGWLLLFEYITMHSPLNVKFFIDVCWDHKCFSQIIFASNQFLPSPDLGLPDTGVLVCLRPVCDYIYFQH